MTKDGIVN